MFFAGSAVLDAQEKSATGDKTEIILVDNGKSLARMALLNVTC
jgi:hypothetical protein